MVKIYKTSKTAFSLKNNPAKFLNGLSSNDMDKEQNALLSIHGRIIATFEQLIISEDEMLIVFESTFVDTALEHLDRYVKLSATKMEKLGAHVYFDLEGSMALEDGDSVIKQKEGQLLITDREMESNVSDEEFTLFRLNNEIAIQGIDYKDEMLLNINEVDFVSFSKGCFLGQEPISKVHSRSKPSWRLVVKSEDDCDQTEKDKMTSRIKDPDSGRVRGFVFEKNK